MQIVGKEARASSALFGKGIGPGRFFIWIRCNPLKRPNSAKGIQGNPSLFPWFYLDLLAFIWLGRGGVELA
jgi:hypothetical protein